MKNCVSFITGVCTVITLQELVEHGFEIAAADEITLYDALFVAASERERVPLLTLDKKLYGSLCEKRSIELI